MRSGWLENQITYIGTVEWVAELRENLTALHKQAYENEESYKQKSKQAYDQSSKPRSYKLGDMVLCHTPGLTGKLHSIWDGPYEVIAKLSDCNYTMAVPNKRSKKLTVHINRPANILRLVVADESEDTPDPIGSIKMGKAPLSEAKESQLKAILAKYPTLKGLGLLKHDQCKIYVEEGNPLRSHPNRIAPGMKNDLKKEIDELLVLGIHFPSKVHGHLLWCL